MHTIELSMSVPLIDTRTGLLITNFTKLRTNGTGIKGIKATIRHVKEPYDPRGTNLYSIYYGLHIDTLELTHKVNVNTPEDFKLIRDSINFVLAQCGCNLTVNDMYVYRIDYSYNVQIQDSALRELFMHLWSKSTSVDARRRKNYSKTHRNEVASINKSYYHNSSSSIQIYDKETEREEKKRPVMKYEDSVLRLEYQTYFREIKSAPRSDFDYWACQERYFSQLSKTADVFFSGDFYSIVEADKRLSQSGIHPRLCERLHNYMVAVSRYGIDKAAEHCFVEGKNTPISKKTARNYQRLLNREGINPIPIPKRYKKDFLHNPFADMLKGGRQ